MFIFLQFLFPFSAFVCCCSQGMEMPRKFVVSHAQTANPTDTESPATKSKLVSDLASTRVQCVSVTLSGLVNYLEVGTCAASKRPGCQRLPTGIDSNVPVFLIRIQDKGSVKATTMYWACTPQDAEVIPALRPNPRPNTNPNPSPATFLSNPRHNPNPCPYPNP